MYVCVKKCIDIDRYRYRYRYEVWTSQEKVCGYGYVRGPEEGTALLSANSCCIPLYPAISSDLYV